MGCKARLNTLGRRLKRSPIRELTKYLFYLFLQHFCVFIMYTMYTFDALS